jgi:hypothetical protein
MSNLLQNGEAIIRSRALLLVAALLWCGLSAFGQVSTGTITGQVSDASGAVVPNVQVRITNVDTNVSRDLVTDSAGLFRAPDLLPGHYSVAVSLAGFQPESKVGLILSVGQTLTLNFTLQPGAQRQTITVMGTAEQLVDLTTSTLGEVITEMPVQNLPLNGRNFYNLIPLSAGVTPPPQGNNQYAINGARGSGTEFLIDGTDVSPSTLDPVRVLPNLEAIGEFKITTNNFTAEYGRALGGIVDTHIRSGSNAWHGSVFEYFRNTVLNARNFFAASRLPYNFNQFGASLGGPLIKDKLFVFGDYQGSRLHQSSPVLTTVPTALEDTGNFSDLLPGTTIYDPLTSPRVPFTNNIIPANRLDPPSALMLSLLPPPNASPPYNYHTSQSFPTSVNSADLRIDYNFSSKDRLSGVFVILRPASVNGPILGNQLNGNLTPDSSIQDERSYSLSYTHVVSPTMVNEFNAAWVRDDWYGIPSAGSQYEPTLGIPGLNTSPNNPITTGLPVYSVTGYNVFGEPLGTPFIQVVEIPQFNDNLSWVRGHHAFKTGFSADFRQYNLNQSLAGRGWYYFNSFATSNLGAGGNSAATALLGYPYDVYRQILPEFGDRMKEYGAYFQDDFKATKRLTLNLGIRWDLYTPGVEAFNRLGNFNPSTVTIQLAGTNGLSNSTLNTNRHDFGPHVGFAYQATADGKTVIRGGYATGYMNLVERDVGTVGDRLETNPPFALISSESYPPLLPPVRVSDGFPLTPQNPQALCCGAATYYIPRSQPMPYMQQWNLDIQRAIPGNFLLDVAYLGSRGVHLTGTSNLNQAPPGPTPATPRSPISPSIGAVTAEMNQGSSIYHALQVKLERRFSSGFYLLGSYTWSKSIDEGSSTVSGDNTAVASSAEPENSFNLRAERGPSDFDLRHRMVVSYIYELPFGKGKKFLNGSSGVVDAFLGGWQVNGITSAQSGFPFTPRLANGSSDINSGPGGIVRPYLVGNPTLTSGQSIHDWFNVAAFAVPGQDGTPAYTFGNAGRNILRGPNTANLDFSLFKTFRLRERLKLEFRSEFFNIFNHPNFGLPNPNVDQPQAGIITVASDPREIQFALKLLF